MALKIYISVAPILYGSLNSLLVAYLRCRGKNAPKETIAHWKPHTDIWLNLGGLVYMQLLYCFKFYQFRSQYS